jgi:hypothetical protein
MHAEGVWGEWKYSSANLLSQNLVEVSGHVLVSAAFPPRE